MFLLEQSNFIAFYMMVAPRIFILVPNIGPAFKNEYRPFSRATQVFANWRSPG